MLRRVTGLLQDAAIALHAVNRIRHGTDCTSVLFQSRVGNW